MNLNLWVLGSELNNYPLRQHILSKPSALTIRTPFICESFPAQPIKDYLYILDAATLPDKIPAENKFSLVISGKPASGWFHSRIDFLYIEKNCSLLSLAQNVFSVFEKYRQWEYAMQKCIDQQLPLVRLAETLRPFSHNPVFAQEHSFKILFVYLPPDVPDTPLVSEYKKCMMYCPGETMTTDHINALISDKEYNRAIITREPTIYKGEPFGYPSLYCNINIRDVTAARVMLDGIIEPFTNKDFAIIKIFAHYLGKALAHEAVYAFNRSFRTEQILNALLEHRHLVDETKINAMLDSIKWKNGDSLVCMVLKINANEDVHSALDPLALRLANMLEYAHYTIKHDQIILVYNITKGSREWNQVFSEMLPFLRDNLLTASFSSIFHQLKQLYYYYQQALYARIIGKAKEPTKWYFHFDEYYLDYIIFRNMEKSIPDVLIPEGLHRLQNYDREKGTSYCQLLKTYLLCERNVAQTIRMEYIHRNTFLYRIEKIHSILNMDLEQPENRLILLIALRVIDYMNKTI